MFDSLLLATDGSGNRRAIQHVLDLATQHNATVHALYVIDIVRSGPGIMGRSNTESSLHDEGRDALESISLAAQDRDISIVTEIREGRPAREICTYANEADVDLLILSPHGRSGFARLLRGSVTEQTLRQAEQPVLTIRKEPVGEGIEVPAQN
ncbi:universal stress protein (plasmid) [Halolamina sp. CBA1230]|uniref:universal stress protein n=1 Tax=Halolamina sp. CBA1230 TaxID=1853690 RepID=UPI001301BFEF|nr:universal stress protein [Halolamina sp. CBA1230]QKY22083.1 universal stress protein [Halolamina sp. CBA1230]